MNAELLNVSVICYSNLASHISQSPKISSPACRIVKTEEIFFKSITYDAKPQRVHAWIKIVVICLLPPLMVSLSQFADIFYMQVYI